MAYHGPVQGVLPYFAERGHICPPQFNPADFISTRTHALLALDATHRSNSSGTSHVALNNYLPVQRTVSLMVDHPEVADQLVRDYKRMHLGDADVSPRSSEESAQSAATAAGAGAANDGRGPPRPPPDVRQLGHLWEATWWTQFSILIRRRYAHV